MQIRAKRRRLLCAAAIVLLGLGAAFGEVLGPAQSQGTAKQEPTHRIALLGVIEGPIGPATVRYVEEVIEAARARDPEIVILRLNTPGGLATSMRDIIAEILGSPVPVVGYVAPSGAHAASAGTYILYATHVAAMAPGTNLGAATPVQIGGGGLPGMPSPKDEKGKDKGADEKGEAKDGGKDGDAAKGKDKAPDDAMTAKAVNDAVAFIRSLAEMHGRNADWAEQAVRQAASLPANEAKDRNVIDLIASDMPSLLAAIDGREVTAGSATRTLATKNLTVERVEPSFVTQALSVLANPNVAFILMMVGIYGLIFEFSNPGSYGPGILGAICLVLALYALNQLPLNYAGLALIILGIAFMVAEAFTPTFGVLGVGGLVAFVIGAAMLMDVDSPAYRLSWWVIGGTAAVSGLLLSVVLGFAWRAHRRAPVSGDTRMVGAEGQVIDWAGGAGHVWAEGERWNARSESDFAAGARVRIRALDGLTLLVGPEDEQPPGETDPTRPK